MYAVPFNSVPPEVRERALAALKAGRIHTPYGPAKPLTMADLDAHALYKADTDSVWVGGLSFALTPKEG